MLSTKVCTSKSKPKWFHQGILKWEVSLYHWPFVWLVWISLFCKWKQKLSVVIQLIPNQSNRGQQYSDTSPFSIPWFHRQLAAGVPSLPAIQLINFYSISDEDGFGCLWQDCLFVSEFFDEVSKFCYFVVDVAETLSHLIESQLA
jgi:hypothetical protein